MEAEFEVFVALALLVIDGNIGFLAAIREGNDVCGFVNPALKLALVAAGAGVWVDGVTVAFSAD